MKKTLKILIALFVGWLNASCVWSTKEVYQLTIEKGEVRNVGKQQVWMIPTTFTNHSKDTLKYWSWFCSWQDDYLIDNDNLAIETTICDKNFPIVVQLAPHESRTVLLNVWSNPGKNNGKEQFSISFKLTLAKSSKDLEELDSYLNGRLMSKVVGSNRLSMK